MTQQWQLPPRERVVRGLMLTGAAFAALVAPLVAEAHVSIDVGDGQYVMELGFRDEPAYTNQPNAIYLRVQKYATGGTEPVDDLAGTLTAEVSRDSKTMTVSLVPKGDGVYEAAFVPTATGDYTFRVSGTIGDAAVDESVTSSPTTFDSVQPLTAIAFPNPLPDPAQIDTSIAAVQAEAGTARTLGIAGIVAGVLGLIAGGVGLARSGKSKAPAPAAVPLEPTGKLVR